ncbi:hypothetical protein F0Q45_13045 [Mycobacterium simiae]|uniref:Uncharacterized protein n=1 Tax=Mycobacterium simiae TaxID=1784 RepID=A0A5B1BPQ3_MYCSI|nr:hypothetical protein [Mycobacterium simiae]KAA1249805.1 hypothetical protein F0Q45_13045 [Mycobacterium simiae]
MTAADYVAGLHRRRAHAYRVPRCDCGCPDPWTCRCDNHDEVTEQYVDGYRDAAQHILDAGLTPAPNVRAMRVMWRRGGSEQRLAQRISEPWEVAV